MRVRATPLVISALAALVAFGQPTAEQNVDRPLNFTRAKTVQDVQEIALVIRALPEIREVFVDTPHRALFLRGTPEQIGTAEWLFKELDQPLSPQSYSAKHEYQMGGSGETFVRVFYLSHAETVQQLQEVATLIRSIAEIRRLFTYNTPRAIVMRGTAEQLTLAQWLVQDLDTNPRPVAQPASAGRHEFRLPGASDDIVRVFYLKPAQTPQRFQEIVTQVRGITRTRNVFTYNAARAAAFRGTLEQIAQAERLIQERDQ